VLANLDALTVHQPWANEIAIGNKPIENRDWPPPPWLIGKALAIHAGKTYDYDGGKWIREHFPNLPHQVHDSELPFGAIVAVALVSGFVATEAGGAPPGILSWAQMEARGFLKPEHGRWFFGVYGWVFGRVVKLPRPVPARGYQKLWKVPTDVFQQVKVQFEAAKWAAKATRKAASNV
jgi:hypothetical protein